MAKTSNSETIGVSSFVGRQRELEILERELIAPSPRSALITGIGGIGKTALAFAFAESHREAFPGGIFRLHATALEALEQTVARHVADDSRPTLVIVNDVEHRPQERVAVELATIRRVLPNARFLLTSRTSDPSGNVDLQLTLPGLSQSEFRELLDKRLGQYANFTDRLHAEVMGHPLAGQLLAELLNRGDLTPRQLLEQMQAFSSPGIVGAEGEELPSSRREHRAVIADVVAVSDAFLQRLHKNPGLLYELSPRGFEELVAELLARLDYQITLTPASKDGGKDIYAAKKDDIGTFLYVVECKKYSPDRPIGVGLVRQLNGVVHAEQATAGILATTSFFTKGAREFQKTIPFQMSLKDYFGIQEWLGKVLGKVPSRSDNSSIWRPDP